VGELQEFIGICFFCLHKSCPIFHAYPRLLSADIQTGVRVGKEGKLQVIDDPVYNRMIFDKGDHYRNAHDFPPALLHEKN
jgi:hypothetical protein